MVTEQVWLYLLSAAVTLICGLFVMLGWFIRGKIRTYDDHLREAEQEQQEFALLQEEMQRHHDEDDKRFDRVDAYIENSRRTLTWVGDCMITLGVKLDVKLPPRPTE